MSQLVCFLIFSSTVLSLSVQEPSPFVYNGTIAKRGEFPWQVALHVPKNSGLSFCGGALISELWVLTAAHCLYGAYFSIRVLVGTTISTGDDPNQREIHSKWWTYYEWYSWTFEGDLGLVKLPEPVTFNDYIKPIALASKSVDLGTSVTVSGWGSVDATGNRVSNLTYSNILIANSTVCRNQNQNGSFCGIPDPNSVSGNICGGDSGGPVVLDYSTNPVLVGVVSWFSGSCGKNTTAGFTNTPLYIEWIREQTNEVL